MLFKLVNMIVNDKVEIVCVVLECLNVLFEVDLLEVVKICDDGYLVVMVKWDYVSKDVIKVLIMCGSVEVKCIVVVNLGVEIEMLVFEELVKEILK